MAGIPVFVAILVGLISSFVQSLGLTIQRKSHVLDSNLPISSRKKPIKRPLWLFGFGIYMTSNIFSTIFQLDALPIVILAPLGAVSLIYNAILARVMLGDQFGSTWIIGTALIALGAVGIAIFGVVEESHHGLNEILLLFKRPPFVVFFTITSFLTALVLIGAHIASFHVYRQLSRIQLPDDNSGDSTPTSLVPSNYASSHTASPAIPFRTTRNSKQWKPLLSSSSDSASSFIPNSNKPDDIGYQTQIHKLSITIPNTTLQNPATGPNQNTDANPSTNSINCTITSKQQRTLTLCGLAFASASGTLSGMCLVLAKAAVELLVISINHWRTGQGENEFLKLQTWFLFLGLIICAVLQLVYLNHSLTFAGPAIICPLAFCFFNLSSIFSGMVFYDQFSRLSTIQITFVSLGVAILLIGVWVVSAVQPDSAVDVGTWIEEESNIDIEEEGESFFPHQESQSPTDHDENGPLAPSSQISNQDRMTQSYPQPQSQRTSLNFTNNNNDETSTPPTLHRSVFSNPDIPSPTRAHPHPQTPTSPLSPISRKHRRTRYGSLIPDLVPTGAPTGFSIGLGASSPGFALRSGSFSHDGEFHPHHGHSPLIGHPNANANASGSGSGSGSGLIGLGLNSESGHGHSRIRSRSEGQRGLMAIITGQDESAYEARTEDQDPDQQGGEHRQEDNQTEGELREWREGDKRKAWWERLFGRKTNRNKIRLEGDEGS
ncbi:uncharacterized protein IL334_003510 [Kwoniella shivajii]|uniref:Uncharacterized protein n=1 Tax=Kwoniella shivajii TaxID=564305 RepID=A0ABZ1CXR4_9TREE|nr:hypothetical protein IL334_003510 [Kwoniella shivajii]